MEHWLGPQETPSRSGQGNRARHPMQQTIDWVLVGAFAWVALLAAVLALILLQSCEPIA
jgi:hypothetical protein